MQRLTKLLWLSLLLASSLLLALLPCGPVIAQRATTTQRPATSQRAVRFVDDDAIGRAFANKTSDIQVEGKGKVIRLLSDDLNGPRHQRFIVQLASRQTLLITHNIDIAPRIAGLKPGDTVHFYGEYVWNSKGGLIHWTHHDPQGRHVSGWVIHNGKTYK